MMTSFLRSSNDGELDELGQELAAVERGRLRRRLQPAATRLAARPRWLRLFARTRPGARRSWTRGRARATVLRRGRRPRRARISRPSHRRDVADDDDIGPADDDAEHGALVGARRYRRSPPLRRARERGAPRAVAVRRRRRPRRGTCSTWIWASTVARRFCRGPTPRATFAADCARRARHHLGQQALARLGTSPSEGARSTTRTSPEARGGGSFLRRARRRGPRAGAGEPFALVRYSGPRAGGADSRVTSAVGPPRRPIAASTIAPRLNSGPRTDGATGELNSHNPLRVVLFANVSASGLVSTVRGAPADVLVSWTTAAELGPAAFRRGPSALRSASRCYPR